MRHGEVGDGGLGREVRRLRRAVGRHARPRRPARAAAGLRHRPAPARRAQERRADGGQGRPVPRRGRAPVPAPFRRRGRLGRRDPAEGGARPRAPGDAGAGAGPGLARGRHRAAEEGQALGRGGAPVLRPARQAGQLPGGGDPLGRDRGGLAAGRLPALPARGLGRRPGATAGVPEEVAFATKPSIALDQIGQALADGVPPGVVVTDAGYGNDTDFRDGVTALGLPYVAGIQGTTGLWPPGRGPLPAEPRSGRGRPPKRLRRDAAHHPLAAERLAAGLPAGAWKAVTWREGTAGPLASRFAAVRVRPAHDDFRLSEPRAEEWLL